MSDEKRKYLVYDNRACGGDPECLSRASCLAMADSTEEAKEFVRDHDLEGYACFSYPVDDHQGEGDDLPIIKGEPRWEWDYHATTGFLTNRQDL